MRSIFVPLILLTGLVNPATADPIDDVLDKHITVKVKVTGTGVVPQKVRELIHPDGTVETIYSIGRKPDIGIKESPARVERPGEHRTKACACGAGCDCDGCQCRKGYKCDVNKCVPLREAQQERELPVITRDGRRYKNIAEYERSLKNEAPAPRPRTLEPISYNNRPEPKALVQAPRAVAQATATAERSQPTFTPATTALGVGRNSSWSNGNMEAPTPTAVVAAANLGITKRRGSG